MTVRYDFDWDPNKEAVFNFPVYLEPDVDDFLSELADKKQVDLQVIVNEWLRASIKLAQLAQ